MIYNYNSQRFQILWKLSNKDTSKDTTYYKSKLVCDKLIPKIKTKRSWITINTPLVCENNSIVFLFNTNAVNYKSYKNLIFIVTDETLIKETEKYGKVIYLPLFTDDVKYDKIITELQSKLNEIDGIKIKDEVKEEKVEDIEK